jgi:exodeoxyribonuclease VII large subunit
MVRAVAVDVQARARRIDGFEDRLNALDPQHVLARGYAWLTDAEGRVLQSVALLAVGASVQATLADGRAELGVRAITPAPLR